MVKARAKAFRNQLSEMSLPDETAERLTKKYASIKDEVFNEVLTDKRTKRDGSVARAHWVLQETTLAGRQEALLGSI